MHQQHDIMYGTCFPCSRCREDGPRGRHRSRSLVLRRVLHLRSFLVLLFIGDVVLSCSALRPVAKSKTPTMSTIAPPSSKPSLLSLPGTALEDYWERVHVHPNTTIVDEGPGAMMDEQFVAGRTTIPSRTDSSISVSSESAVESRSSSEVDSLWESANVRPRPPRTALDVTAARPVEGGGAASPAPPADHESDSMEKRKPRRSSRSPASRERKQLKQERQLRSKSCESCLDPDFLNEACMPNSGELEERPEREYWLVKDDAPVPVLRKIWRAKNRDNQIRARSTPPSTTDLFPIPEKKKLFSVPRARDGSQRLKGVRFCGNEVRAIPGRGEWTPIATEILEHEDEQHSPRHDDPEPTLQNVLEPLQPPPRKLLEPVLAGAPSATEMISSHESEGVVVLGAGIASNIPAAIETLVPTTLGRLSLGGAGDAEDDPSRSIDPGPARVSPIAIPMSRPDFLRPREAGLQRSTGHGERDRSPGPPSFPAGTTVYPPGTMEDQGHDDQFGLVCSPGSRALEVEPSQPPTGLRRRRVEQEVVVPIDDGMSVDTAALLRKLNYIPRSVWRMFYIMDWCQHFRGCCRRRASGTAAPCCRRRFFLNKEEEDAAQAEKERAFLLNSALLADILVDNPASVFSGTDDPPNDFTIPPSRSRGTLARHLSGNWKQVKLILQKQEASSRAGPSLGTPHRADLKWLRKLLINSLDRLQNSFTLAMTENSFDFEVSNSIGGHTFLESSVACEMRPPPDASTSSELPALFSGEKENEKTTIPAEPEARSATGSIESPSSVATQHPPGCTPRGSAQHQTQTQMHFTPIVPVRADDPERGGHISKGRGEVAEGVHGEGTAWTSADGNHDRATLSNLLRLFGLLDSGREQSGDHGASSSAETDSLSVEELASLHRLGWTLSDTICPHPFLGPGRIFWRHSAISALQFLVVNERSLFSVFHFSPVSKQSVVAASDNSPVLTGDDQTSTAQFLLLDIHLFWKSTGELLWTARLLCKRERDNGVL